MGKIKDIFTVLKQLLYVLSEKQKYLFVFVFVITVVASFFELLGVSIIMPFIEAVTDPVKLRKKGYIESICSWLDINTDKELLIFVGIVIIIVFVLKNIFMVFSAYVQYSFASKVSLELSIKMLSGYLKRPYDYFLEVNSAEIIRGCTNDTDGVYGIVSNLLQLMAELLSVSLIAIYLIYVDPIIAFFSLGLMIVVMFFVLVVFKPIFKNLGRKYLHVITEKTKIIYQITNGIKELYVTKRENIFLKEYAVVSRQERGLSKRRDVLNACPDRITEGICVSGIIGIIVFRLSTNDDSMIHFLPQLATFAMAAFRVLPSVGKISSRVNGIVYQIPTLDNVYENFKCVEQIEKVNDNIVIEELNELENMSFCDKIELKDIRWKYNTANSFVFEKMNLVIEKGESIGLIGPSGSGKTTLSDIILGLLHPQMGTVTVDGVDIFSIPKQWAKMVGYVPQSVFLIDDTVRNNVLFGLKDNNDEAVWRALEQAQLKSFVESLPEGLDTIVGERGVKFSGGQRQRIAIARALYQQPQILVLDEATAALDNETENAVMEAIESLQGTITMIIVAHRLTTIRKCDKVYEIRDGVANLIDKKEIFD